MNRIALLLVLEYLIVVSTANPMANLHAKELSDKHKSGTSVGGSDVYRDNKKYNTNENDNHLDALINDTVVIKLAPAVDPQTFAAVNGMVYHGGIANLRGYHLFSVATLSEHLRLHAVNTFGSSKTESVGELDRMSIEQRADKVGEFVKTRSTRWDGEVEWYNVQIPKIRSKRHIEPISATMQMRAQSDKTLENKRPYYVGFSSGVRQTTYTQPEAQKTSNGYRYISTTTDYNVVVSQKNNKLISHITTEANKIPSSKQFRSFSTPTTVPSISVTTETTRLKDPLYPSQWHLDKIDARGAWAAGYTGRGVGISIVDDGMQYDHPDIAPNFWYQGSWDYNRRRSSEEMSHYPEPTLSDDHGTSAAGVAAAAANSICGVGVAYNARLSGIRLIATSVTDAIEANGVTHWTNPDTSRDTTGLSANNIPVNDVVSCSWGPPDDGRRLEGPGPLLRLAMLDSAAHGRNGLGTVFVWASGNGRQRRDSCSYDGYASSRLAIAVGAVDNEGNQAWYSEGCPALMVSAPSSGRESTHAIITTDLTGSRGSSIGDCTFSFGGTSAATPMVAGVIALMLEANPKLTRRDVQHVLIESASRSPVVVTPSQADWEPNGAGFWHSHRFGFGVVNASNAVLVAKNWKNVGPQVEYVGETVRVDTVLRDNGATSPDLASSFIVSAMENISGTENIIVSEKPHPPRYIEWVEVVFSAKCRRGDVSVSLVSPSGTVSVFASEHDDFNENYNEWIFSSCRHWGEPSTGTWTLRVRDTRVGRPTTFGSWKLRLYGTDISF